MNGFRAPGWHSGLVSIMGDGQRFQGVWPRAATISVPFHWLRRALARSISIPMPATDPRSERRFTLSDFDFPLPPGLIAQHPTPRRSDSRLLDGSAEQP